MAKSNVISNDNSKDHIIDAYHFKVMSEFSNDNEIKKPENTENSATNEEKTPPKQEEKTQEEAVVKALDKEEDNALKSSFVEDLLKKTDEMSSNIIKLQMQIESQENEFNNRLNSELEAAKEKYSKEGYEKAKAEFEKDLEELKEKFLKSVGKLEETSEKMEHFINKNEKDLANTAIEIAKEVIAKEVQTNSAQIAYNLANELISELKGAEDVEIKVNPNDYDFIKSKFQGKEHFKITLDDAISKGSVVVLSNLANMEANLSSRLAKIQKMVSE